MEGSAHLSDVRGATTKLGDRSDVMANVTMQFMGEDSGSGVPVHCLRVPCG